MLYEGNIEQKIDKDYHRILFFNTIYADYPLPAILPRRTLYGFCGRIPLCDYLSEGMIQLADNKLVVTIMEDIYMNLIRQRNRYA